MSTTCCIWERALTGRDEIDPADAIRRRDADTSMLQEKKGVRDRDGRRQSDGKDGQVHGCRESVEKGTEEFQFPAEGRHNLHHADDNNDGDDKNVVMLTTAL